MGGLAVRANLLCVTVTSGRGRVLLFDIEARQLVSQWAVLPPPAGYSDANGVAMDQHFQLFVADTVNHRVRHYTAFGRHVADLGLPRPAGLSGRDRPGVLDHPNAVAIHGDTIYVACGERPARRSVQRLHTDGRVQKPLLPADPEGRFGAPRGLWADAEGLLVADTLHGRLLRFRHGGTYLAAVATVRAGQMSRPTALARIGGGRLLYLETGDQPGLRLLAATGQAEHLPAALLQHVSRPLAFAADEQGRFYVLDHAGERVQRFGADLAFDDTVVELPEYLDAAPPPDA
jgi:sugar lactone lactonase YvrE